MSCQAKMDETEQKKQGKLVEGLSGSALQVVRELSLDKLATRKGPTELIEYLYKSTRSMSMGYSADSQESR